MNTTFLWPTLAILLVATIWQITYNLQRSARSDTQGLRQSIAVTLFQWIMIIGMAIMGYCLAGIIGLVGVLLAMLVLSIAVTIVILAATGRIRRR